MRLGATLADLRLFHLMPYYAHLLSPVRNGLEPTAYDCAVSGSGVNDGSGAGGIASGSNRPTPAASGKYRRSAWRDRCRRRGWIRLSINLVLCLAFLPFAVFGWSLHSVLPGHDHSHCEHFHHGHFYSGHSQHGQIASSASKACCPSGDLGRDGNDSSRGSHAHSVDAGCGILSLADDTLPEVPLWSVSESHDCDLCKILSQLRFRKFTQPVLPTGDLPVPVAEIRLQNAVASAFSIYLLRGPPALAW